MPVLKELETAELLRVKAEADADPQLEHTREFVQHELARRLKLGDTTLLALAAENNGTGIVDALADGAPTSPTHVDQQWQSPRYLHSPLNYPDNIELGRE